MRSSTLRATTALGCFALVATASVDAFAFCRTRTVGTPANYDASQGGCFTKGEPLFWKNACVGYSIYIDPQNGVSKYIGYAAAADQISTAFTRWTGATCTSDGNGNTRPSIDVRDLGSVSCGKIEYVSGAANQNAIVFRDTYWPLAKDLGVLGLTTVKYSPTTGEIFGADMEINTHDMNDDLTFTNPVMPGQYDFLSIVTHEAGHFLGMAHSNFPHTTMFATYSHENGDTFQRYLSADDILGICSIYRPDGERSVLKNKVYPAPQCDPTPRGGFSTTCQEKPGFKCDSSMSPAPPTGGAFWALGVATAVLASQLRRRGR